MDVKDANKLIVLNKKFYKKVGEDFDRTRKTAWEGWEKVSHQIISGYPTGEINVLDLACGNGRFATFLNSKNILVKDYYGIDSSIYLIEKAKDQGLPENFRFALKDILNDTINLNQKFDVVCSFGFMHHIPSREMRLKFIENCLSYCKAGGLVILSFWSNLNAKNTKTFEELSDEAKDVYSRFENGDCFFGWSKTKMIERYCHMYSENEITELLLTTTNSKLIHMYRSDGKSGKDNIYVVLKKGPNIEQIV